MNILTNFLNKIFPSIVEKEHRKDDPRRTPPPVRPETPYERVHTQLSWNEEAFESLRSLLLFPVAILFLGGVLSPIVILASQSVVWLRSGQWPKVSVERFLGWLEKEFQVTTWLGLNEVIEWWLRLPLSLSVATT